MRAKTPPGFQLQPDDIRILSWLYEQRFLTTPMIQALLKRGYDGTTERLKKLFHAELVLRLAQPRSYGSSQEPMTYALSNAGADVLAERQGIERGRIDWGRKNREVTRVHISHTLMVNRFRISLQRALDTVAGANVQWVAGHQMKGMTLVRDRERALVPDGFLFHEARAAVRRADGGVLDMVQS